MIWKKFTFAAKIIVIWIIFMSCLWGPYDGDYRVQIFGGAVGISKNMYPFFYSMQTLNRNFQDAYMDQYTFPQENIDEWRTIVKGNYSDDDIIKFVYTFSFDTLNIIKNKKIDFGNKFVNSIIKNNQTYILDYIFFARQVENALPQQHDYWDEDTVATDWNLLKTYLNTAKTLAFSIKDKNLMQRYAYQAIVLARYSNKPQEAIDIYNKTFAKVQKSDESILKYWALTHVAYCTGGETELLDYLDIFYNCDAKKQWCYTQLDIKQLAGLTGKMSDEQKYTYLVLKELHNPGRSLNGIKQIAKLDPNHELFRLLVNREVNKLENWLLTQNYIDYKMELEQVKLNIQSDTKYAQDFTKFLVSILPNINTENKAYTELVITHLYFLVNDLNNASIHLKNAENLTKTKDETEQYYVEKILLETKQTTKYSDDFAEKLLKDFKQLNCDDSNVVQNSKVFQSLIQAEYRIFNDKKMYDIAALFVASGTSKNLWSSQTWWNFSDVFFYLDKYASIEQVNNFVKIEQKTNKNSLEKFLLKDYKFDLNRYYDLLGTMELRQDNLENALEYYKNIPTDFWYSDNNYYKVYLNQNPFDNLSFFKGYIGEIDSNYADKSYFVQKLIEIRNNYKNSSGEERGKYAMQLGNAYSSMSFNGKSWFYVCYGQSVYGGRLPWTAFNTYVNDNYNNCWQAFKYYDEALSLLQDEKLKSEAFFYATGTYAYLDKGAEQVNKYQGDYYMTNYWNLQTPNKSKDNPYAKKFKAFSPNEFEFYLSACGY